MAREDRAMTAIEMFAMSILIVASISDFGSGS